MIARLLTLGLVAIVSTCASVPSRVARVELVATSPTAASSRRRRSMRPAPCTSFITRRPPRGDLYYVRRAASAAEFSAPIRVSSDPNSAIAAGAVRGRPAQPRPRRLGPRRMERVTSGHAERRVDHADSGARCARWGREPSSHSVRSATTRSISMAAERSRRIHRRRLHRVARERRNGWRNAPPDAARGLDRRRRALRVRHGACRTRAARCSCCSVQALIDASGWMQHDLPLGRRWDPPRCDLDDGRTAGRLASVALQPWRLPACPMTTFAIAEGAARSSARG